MNTQQAPRALGAMTGASISPPVPGRGVDRRGGAQASATEETQPAMSRGCSPAGRGSDAGTISGKPGCARGDGGSPSPLIRSQQVK